MMIHTDTITQRDLHNALAEVSYLLGLEVQAKGSRKRNHAYSVSIEWFGDKVKGDGRRRSNSGQYGADVNKYAATWDEWGEWIAKLFEIDPTAIIGQYDGQEDFMRQTREALPWAAGSKGAQAPWLSC